MKHGLKLHFNINSSHVANRNVCCMLLSKSLGDKHASYIIQNHDHLGSRRPHTQSTCCKHCKQFSSHHDRLWLKREEGRMEPGIPSLIADQMRVHLKTGSSWYIYIYQTGIMLYQITRNQKPKANSALEGHAKKLQRFRCKRNRHFSSNTRRNQQWHSWKATGWGWLRRQVLQMVWAPILEAWRKRDGSE